MIRHAAATARARCAAESTGARSGSAPPGHVREVSAEFPYLEVPLVLINPILAVHRTSLEDFGGLYVQLYLGL